MAPVVVFVPIDAASRSVGADEVATAIVRAGWRRGASVRLVRNGSRGLLWLEPLVEVNTPAGRVAYGPVDAAERRRAPRCGMLEAPRHRLCLGPDRGDRLPQGSRPVSLSPGSGIIDPLSVG